MTDMFAGLPLVEGELVTKEEKALVKKAPDDLVQDVVREIAEDTLRVSQDAMHFAAIDPQQDDPPDEWVRQLGLKRAMERFRTAKYALMGAKEAPVGLKIAAQLSGSIIKAKSAAQSNVIDQLNVQQVFITAPMPQFPELELDSED